jgi:hypothetical protein
MKKRLLLISVTFVLILAACSKGQSKASQTNTPSANATPTLQAGASSAIPTASQGAAIKEFQNNVTVRTSAGGNYAPAVAGMAVPVGGSVQTGDNSRARVDLLPDGTIIRVGPNSLYTVTDISINQNGKSSTRIKLDFGQIWILLKGGQLQVETPSGVASVRGSLLSAKYDPTLKKLQASCLEGHCGLQGDQGKEVELTDGQSSTVEENQPPSDPAQMSEEELAQWVNENPDSIDFFDGQIPDWLPTPDPSLDPYQDMPTDSALETPTDTSLNAPTDAPTDVPPADVPPKNPPPDNPTDVPTP